MKILVQSDDYGFTKGVVDACCDAFENGFLKCTGLFANMPVAEYAVKRMLEYPDICFGIDINVSTGPCVADRRKLPHLVDPETGWFIKTTERIKDKDYAHKLFRPYEECLIEARAQIERFIELTGRKPEYVCPHSDGGEKEYLYALSDVAREYDLPYREEVLQQFGFHRIREMGLRCKYEAQKNRKTYDNIREAQVREDIFSVENQMLDEVEPTLKGLQEVWDQGIEYVYMAGHCGWVDADLFRYTRCNINRAFDHEMYTSSRIIQWFNEHDVELITYRDLPWREMRQF